MLRHIKETLKKPFFTDQRTLLALWILLPIIAGLTKLSSNNFKIYRHVFWHLWQQVSLFAPYPEEYADTNHYGPLFALVIAPFAVMPPWLGIVLWNVCMTLCLYMAIRRMPLAKRLAVFALWFCAHELLTALFMVQFNVVVAAILLGTWACVERERDWAAALLIVIGTLVKLYGVVGLAFFFFSRHKMRFALWCVVWSVVLFALPMLLSSPAYVVGQYAEWLTSLVEKNAQNTHVEVMYQNISLLGFVRSVGSLLVGAETMARFSDLWLIGSGAVLFCLPYLRLDQWRSVEFRSMFVASATMFVVLFSTGTESSGYIIAFAGISIWYCCAPWQRSKCDVALLVFAFILSSMSPSDLFPAWVRREIVQPYALKALPVIVIWLKLVCEMLTRDYVNQKCS